MSVHTAPRSAPSERGHGEQCPERLMCRSDRLLKLFADKDRTALGLEIFGRSEESISVVGILPFQPSRQAANL